MTIVEKAAYLKGLTEGMGLDPEAGEGKLWGVLTELMSDIAHKLEEHEQGLDAHEETLDDVYEPLIYLQEITLPTEEVSDYDEDDEEDEEEDEDDALYTPSLRLYESEEEDGESEDGDEAESEENEEDKALSYDGVLYDVTCPGCGETITFDEETLDKGSIQCPNCGETLEFDLGGDENE